MHQLQARALVVHAIIGMCFPVDIDVLASLANSSIFFRAD